MKLYLSSWCEKMQLRFSGLVTVLDRLTNLRNDIRWLVRDKHLLAETDYSFYATSVSEQWANGVTSEAIYFRRRTVLSVLRCFFVVDILGRALSNYWSPEERCFQLGFDFKMQYMGIT